MMSRFHHAKWPLFMTVVGTATIWFSNHPSLSIKLVWNASESVPVGLYYIQKGKPEWHDIVLVTLPESIRSLANERQYLPSNVLALKRVRGVTGDTICRFGRTVSINWEQIVDAQLRDDTGRKMPEWSGCFRLNSGEVFLLSDHPKSFDGRYFGASKVSDVIEIAYPLWTRKHWGEFSE